MSAAPAPRIARHGARKAGWHGRDDPSSHRSGPIHLSRRSGRASPSPLALLKIAAERAAADAGIGARGAWRRSTPWPWSGFTIDAPGALQRLPIPHSTNPPASLAKALGATPRLGGLFAHGRQHAPAAGQRAGRADRRGRDRAWRWRWARSSWARLMKRLTKGLGFDDWRGRGRRPAGAASGSATRGPASRPTRRAHGLNRPINIYPLFENALRRPRRALAGRPPGAARRAVRALHRGRGGQSRGLVPDGADAPRNWSTVSDKNRMVGFPYPKLPERHHGGRPVGRRDRSPACARRASWACRRTSGSTCTAAPTPPTSGIPLDRQNYHSSPAMRLTGQRALEMAGDRPGARSTSSTSIPASRSAVEIGAEELGLALDDPRGLDGDRRAALCRRAGEQLRHALDRGDDAASCATSPGPRAWSPPTAGT